MPPADPDRFWEIIDRTLDAKDDAAQCEALKRALDGVPEEGLIAFDADYRRTLARAYGWDLWAAAYIINGGCSDDGFDYFRDWLISRGRRVYEAALADPETLIGAVEPYEAEFEVFRYVVQDVFEARFDRPLPWFELQPGAPPEDEPFDEATVDQRHPRLASWVRERA